MFLPGLNKEAVHLASRKALVRESNGCSCAVSACAVTRCSTIQYGNEYVPNFQAHQETFWVDPRWL